jgi:hypothetical protein
MSAILTSAMCTQSLPPFNESQSELDMGVSTSHAKAIILKAIPQGKLFPT